MVEFQITYTIIIFDLNLKQCQSGYASWVCQSGVRSDMIRNVSVVCGFDGSLGNLISSYM